MPAALDRVQHLVKRVLAMSVQDFDDAPHLLATYLTPYLAVLAVLKIVVVVGYSTDVIDAAGLYGLLFAGLLIVVVGGVLRSATRIAVDARWPPPSARA